MIRSSPILRSCLRGSVSARSAVGSRPLIPTRNLFGSGHDVTGRLWSPTSPVIQDGRVGVSFISAIVAGRQVLIGSRRSYVTSNNGVTPPVVEPSIPLGQQTGPASNRPPPPSRRSFFRSRRARPLRALLYLAAFLAASYLSYTYIPTSRHVLQALIRCTRLLRAVVLDVLDYKWTFAKVYSEQEYSKEEIKQLRRSDRHACHARSSERLFEALKKNAGIYVKLGQHVASMQVLPKEWTETMRPLQDQCYPTPLPQINAMLVHDIGLSIDELFIDFDPVPIGVASLAQVHTAIDRRTGGRVAVKVQHPHLEDFVKIDIATVNWSMKFVKAVFPDFEFSWLGEEMNNMLPLEMDFAHEAYNADRVREEFLPLKGKTSLVIPQVLWAEKRCMAMEFIEGARVDDLVYLKKHKIDRNLVSQELSRIFSQMVYINGYFHADPHQGNILIRPRQPGTKNPMNFEVCLLDWGQCFDVPKDLRVNYARLWLSLIAGDSEKAIRDRRKYAKLVGNIGGYLYPILETAITGRIGLADSESTSASAVPKADNRKRSLMQMSSMDEKEMNIIRTAMVEREGLIQDIFSLLRQVPRRLVMILKLNDLTRSLDQSLATTHGSSRVFLIVARCCSRSVWQDDKEKLRARYRQFGFSVHFLTSWISCWWQYEKIYHGLKIVEVGMDARARLVKLSLFVKGLTTKGWSAAFDTAAGIA